MLKDYGHIHKGGIWSICCSPDDSYLFTSDDTGCIKQFNVKTKNLYKDHGQVDRAFIRSILITPNGQNLFVSDLNGKLMQFKINDKI